ncbi:MAG: BrnT family toxin [Nitrospirae bacterium]|nr:BrnT family toxin [Nitrospirota bacterium]
MINEKSYGLFVWDIEKEENNIRKHGINFTIASKSYYDPHRIIVIDEKHSEKEQRYFCIGKVNDCIITVRFIYRDNKIRIFGAGYWRKGRILYECAK